MSDQSAWLSPQLGRRLRGSLRGSRLVCLVDGEHYPPVVGAAVRRLNECGCEVTALLFLGGTEKVEDAAGELAQAAPDAEIHAEAQSRREALDLLRSILRRGGVDAVVDLSDEPVIDYAGRYRFASHALAEGVPYLGADFQLSPPPWVDVLSKPSLAIIGTGKRVGKTAVSVSVARLLKREGLDPVVVCMGRGGPPAPEYVNTEQTPVDADYLLDVARRGGHAASDHWEDALLSGVPAVGCRRCGGGMSGTPVQSNVIEGARLAEKGPHSFVIMEGSGATFAPVRTDRRLVVIGAGQPPQNVLGYLGEYRLLISDLAVITMCEEPVASPQKVEGLRDGIRRINPDLDVVLTVFRPEPLGSVEGKRVFLASTAPKPVAEDTAQTLEREHGCRVAGLSTNLSDRRALRGELEGGLKNCDALLTEIKAGSIDIAAMAAREQGADIIFLHNRLQRVGGTVGDLDGAVLNLCRQGGGECR